MSDHSLFRRLYDGIAERLSRVTSSGDLIPEIDGLRFIAISTVVFHHLMSMYLSSSGRSPEVRSFAEWSAAAKLSWLVIPAYCGHFGVHLFFVISGFILALPFAKRTFEDRPAPGLKSYYWRRVTRIEPPYVISLLLYFVIHWVQRGEGPEVVGNLVASLFYAHGLVYGQESVINSVTWSLEIEIQFYLLVPWLVSIFRIRDVRRRRAWLFGLIVFFGLLSQWVIYRSGIKRLEISLLNFVQYFLTGFLLADLYLTGWLQRARKSYGWDVVTLFSAVGILVTLTWFGWTYSLLPLMVGALYTGCFLGRLSNALVRLRWIVLIGGMCYTIYLYHVMIIANALTETLLLASRQRWFSLDFVLQGLMICPALLVICAWLFVKIEKPFMRWSLSSRPSRRMMQPSAAD